MKRRAFLGAMALAALPAIGGNRRRIVALLPRESCDEEMKFIRPGLTAALARIGFADVVLESHCFGSNLDRAEVLAREIIRSQPEVIVIEGTPATRVVARLTKTIPIMAVLGDPVAGGFASDLARPEGNLTGFSNTRPGSEGKVVELARLAMPHLSGMVLVSEDLPEAPRQIEPYVEAARSAGIPAQVRIVHADGLEAVFRAMRRDQVAFLQWGNIDRDRTAALSLRYGAGTILNARGYVERGGLMSYSVHITDPVSKQAALLGKLLRGIRPPSIPWELPDRSHLAINMRVARALGIAVSPELRVLADQVVEA